MIVAVVVDQLDFANTDLLVDARAVLRGGLRRSHWATNGCALLMLLQRSCCRRPRKDQDKPRISQRLSIGSRPPRAAATSSGRVPAARYRRHGSRPQRCAEKTCIR